MVYLLSGSHGERNHEIHECLSKDILELLGQWVVIILGDFNGHLNELDGRRDANGNRVLNLARSNDLMIGNVEGKCDGAITWTREISASASTTA